MAMFKMHPIRNKLATRSIRREREDVNEYNYEKVVGFHGGCHIGGFAHRAGRLFVERFWIGSLRKRSQRERQLC